MAFFSSSNTSSNSKACFVISAACLGSGDRARLRSFVLLAAGRLQAAWSVTDLYDNADCILRPPVPGESMGTIEVTTGERKAERTMLYEVMWPLSDTHLPEILNRVSLNLAANASGGRVSWVRNLLGGGVKPAVKLEPPRDLRQATTSVLARFGRLPSVPDVNLLLVGSPGSGKTTAIASVSDIPMRATEVAATDAVSALKSRTTIALDYGECDLVAVRARLYGTPGQLRFAHMIQQALSRADAILVLVDVTRPDPFEDVRHYIEVLGIAASTRPLMLAYTHMDVAEVPKELRSRLQALLGRSFPSVQCDPRDKGSVRRAITLLANEAHAARNGGRAAVA